MAANIVVADVVVTLDTRDIEALGLGKIISFPIIAFGHASLQLYPNTGNTIGVPMPAAGKFGMKKTITRMFIQGDPARGYVYVYDSVRNTIRIYENGGFTPPGTIAFDPHTHDVRIIGGVTADEDLGVLASGPTLGKLAANNRVIAGADQATKGGVVPVVATASVSGSSVAAGALVEVANGTVVLVTTLRLMVIGA